MIRYHLTRLAPLAALLLVGLLVGCGGDKPEALVASARSFLAKNDRAAAIVQLRNVLQKNPDLAEARFLLGKTLFETDAYAAAQKELRKASELGYPADDVIPLLAETMLRSGEFKKVIDEFGKSAPPPGASANGPAQGAEGMTRLGASPSKDLAGASAKTELTTPEARAALLTTLGKAYLALGDAEASKDAFAAALVAKPDYSPALLGQALPTARKGDVPGALVLVEEALAKSPKLTEAWQLKGDILLAQGRPDDALVAYRAALDSKGAYLPAHAAIVTLLARQGKLEDASQQLDAMKKIAPKHPQTLYLQAQLAYWQKNFPAARDAIQQVLKVTPDNLAGLLIDGAVAFELKSYAQAEADLTKVLRAAPSHPLARRLLVGTYLSTERPGKALEALRPALDKIGNDSDMLTLAGVVYMQNGNATEATRYFEKAAALDPKSTGKKTTVALAHIARGDKEQALRDLEQATVADPTARADLALIATYIRQRDYAKALAAIDVLEKKQPADPLPHNLRGTVLLEKNDVPGARKSFERALAINPAYFPAAERLARLDLADKKPDDARKRMEAVLAKDPKQTQALLALAEMRAMAGGTADEVATLIGKAIAANPTEVTPRLVLVAHYLRSKDTKKAVAAGQEALVAIPDRPEILEALGRAQQAAGDANQAIATYSKWARLLPDSPVPLLRMAEVQTAAKDNDAALQNLRKALALKPDLVDAQRGIIALELAADRKPQALEIARDVQKQRPKEAIGFLFEGDIHASKKDWAQAAAAYGAGLKKSPSTDLATRLYRVLVASGDVAGAERYAKTWLKDYPKDKAFRVYVADDALARRDFATAHQHYRALLDIDPNNILVLNNLAWTAGQVKDPKALEYAEKANLLAPNQPSLMDTLGTLLIEKGDTARGVELLRKASGLAPNSPILRLSLAKGLIKANQKDAAKKELEALAKLGDKFPAQAEVTKLMQGL